MGLWVSKRRGVAPFFSGAPSPCLQGPARLQGQTCFSGLGAGLGPSSPRREGLRWSGFSGGPVPSTKPCWTDLAQGGLSRLRWVFQTQGLVLSQWSTSLGAALPSPTCPLHPSSFGHPCPAGRGPKTGPLGHPEPGLVHPLLWAHAGHDTGEPDGCQCAPWPPGKAARRVASRGRQRPPRVGTGQVVWGLQVQHSALGALRDHSAPAPRAAQLTVGAIQPPSTLFRLRPPPHPQLSSPNQTLPCPSATPPLLSSPW